LKGANKPPPPLPEGFTARGWVALVFSILSAVVGMGVIGWYGAGEIGTKTPSKRPEGVAIVALGEDEVKEVK
jgi:iron transport multicopper oxidase